MDTVTLEQGRAQRMNATSASRPDTTALLAVTLQMALSLACACISIEPVGAGNPPPAPPALKSP